MTSDDDRTLSELAAGLKTGMSASGLWNRIESALAEEKASRARWRKGFLAAGLAAAVLLMVVPPALFFSPAGKSTMILDDAEALTLFEEERDLVAQIESLEPRLQEALAHNGGDARNRLEYVDWNLENCRRAADGNRMNTYVRHALLSCYRKKLEIMRGTLSR